MLAFVLYDLTDLPDGRHCILCCFYCGLLKWCKICEMSDRRFSISSPGHRSVASRGWAPEGVPGFAPPALPLSRVSPRSCAGTRTSLPLQTATRATFLLVAPWSQSARGRRLGRGAGGKDFRNAPSARPTPVRPRGANPRLSDQSITHFKRVHSASFLIPIVYKLILCSGDLHKLA